MMSYQVFVVISTGQQIANLPPILEYAVKGDLVLWLESEQAIRANWTFGAWQVLQARGLEQCKAPISGDMDEPVAVADSFIAAVKEVGVAGSECSQMNIVLNGGKKLTPIGIVAAVQEMQASEALTCNVCFLYGDNQPVQMKTHASTIMEYQQINRYDAGRMLSVDEIFSINGLRKPQINRRWMWGQDCESEAYGVDETLTRLVHDCYVRGFDSDTGSLTNTTNWPAYERWTPRSKEAWRNQIEKRLQSVKPAVIDNLDTLALQLSATVRKFNPRIMQRELEEDECTELGKEGWADKAGRMRLGFRFELAVWRRTITFLDAHPEYMSIVRECLLSVQVDREGRREKDLDVVLVLSNGILIHLECKTWTFKKKDADARLLVLQKASSRLARMYAVAPMFPSMADAAWFPKMHDRYGNMKNNLGAANVLAYTMPDPPDEYSVHISSRNETVCFQSPPSFEESMQNTLRPFLPE